MFIKVKHNLVLFFIVVCSSLFANSFEIVDSELIEIDGGEKIIYKPSEFLTMSKGDLQVIAIMRSKSDYLPRIVIKKDRENLNIFNVPDKYINIITTILDIDIVENKKVMIIFHSNPSNSLYALYDFNKNCINYYYCSTLWYDKANDIVVHIFGLRMDNLKMFFEVFINDVSVATFSNIGSSLEIVSLDINNKKLIIRFFPENNLKEIFY